MHDGRIVAQGTYEELEKVKEFKEIMEINSLNANLNEDDKGSAKGSAEGDTESMGDHSSTDQDAADDEIHEMIKRNSSHQAISRESRRSAKKQKEKEESDRCESGDSGADEEEEKVDTASWPSKLTPEEKLGRLGRF